MAQPSHDPQRRDPKEVPKLGDEALHLKPTHRLLCQPAEHLAPTPLYDREAENGARRFRHHCRHGDHGRQVAAEIDRPDHPRDCLLAQLPKRFILWEILQALRGCLAPEIQEQLKEKMRFSEKKHHFLFVSYEKALHLRRN